MPRFNALIALKEIVQKLNALFDQRKVYSDNVELLTSLDPVHVLKYWFPFA